jgi:predicted metalloprotease with PDZ domain
MTLGATFSVRPDGTLEVLTVQPAGSVASAGGNPGDRWIAIDGTPPAEAFVAWQDGTRQRRPGIPLTVEVLRDGERLVHRPMWRTDEPSANAFVPSADTEHAPDAAARPGDDYSAPGPFSASVMGYLATESSEPRVVTRDAAAERYNPFAEIDRAVERAIYGR